MNLTISNVVPPLRWAGGKIWLLRYLKANHNFNNYHEPFLGGGAIFINVTPHHNVYLNDSNSELINFYTQVKDNIESLISYLKKYENKNNKDDYYKIRSRRVNDPIKALVEEVTDDKTLPKFERKQRQIDHAKELTGGAALIKLGDKISNVTDITNTPPTNWGSNRRLEYFEWAEEVINNCPKVNTSLEKYFKDSIQKGREKLQ